MAGLLVELAGWRPGCRCLNLLPDAVLASTWGTSAADWPAALARPPHPHPPLQVSGGNGEQVMSRDVHRLSTQFDFFRLMSFYHSGGWVGEWVGGKWMSVPAQV